MGKKFIIQGNVMTDTMTGSTRIFEEGKLEHYAVIVQTGHCGTGYYIPQIIGVSASSKALAAEIARKRGKIKSSRSGAVIDIMKISEIEKNYLSYLTECDRLSHSYNIKTQLMERRIAMEEAVDFDGSGPRGKIPAELVKTSDKYSNVHVLQRYLAPRYQGNKLIYPKSINFRALLDEHFYYSTLQLGIFMKKISPLSFYYQIYGDKNGLGIKYAHGRIHYNDGDERISIEAPDTMRPYLEETKKKLDAERKIKEEKERRDKEAELRPTKNKSATEKFNARYEKYQQIKNSRTPIK